eukprot:scaffold20928_cov181-Skeletonema_marinoi.AAC.1
MSYYDPNHPDADWSGYVSVSSRKHVQEPKRGDEDQWKPSKRIDIAPTSNDSTLDLIGGPVPKDDPSTLDSCNWQSEAQAASVRTKTTVDQLTETGRSQIRYKNKKLGMPASLISGNDTVAASLSEDPYYILHSEDGPLERIEISHLPLSNDPNLDLVGYRQITKTSLLASLGKDLYASAPSLVTNKE